MSPQRPGLSVPSFKRLAPAPFRSRAREGRQRFRGSARERGYTTEWDNLRDEYIRLHPVCEECRRRGFLTIAEVVDHMKPVADRPDDRLNPKNLDSLCHRHHNGWKRRIEQYARKLGEIDMLPTWVKQPETRPAGFQIKMTGPVAQDGTVSAI